MLKRLLFGLVPCDFFQTKQSNFVPNFCRGYIFCCAGIVSADLLCIRREFWKTLWARMKEIKFEFAEDCVEHLNSKEILCIYRPKTSNVSNNRGYRSLMECIQCLRSKLFDHLIMTTSQSLNDRKEYLLRIDTSQLALIPAPIVH